MTPLTEHFSLEEMTRSSTAERLLIDNTPVPDIVDALRIAARGMEQVRGILGDLPIQVDSGYRCPALNRAVGGALGSAHMYGYAVDFICPKFGSPLEIVKAIEASPLRFDKCIQEGSWVHISFAPALRRIMLTAHFGPSGPTYIQGV